METLTQITQQDEDRRKRAYTFESLTREAETLRIKINRLGTATVDVAALEKILDLCDRVPNTLVTRSSSSLFLSIPSGLVARDALKQVAGGALADSRRRDNERKDDLAKAIQRLAVVERELKDFD